ncbi:hypothetical protein [Marinobacter caseinilyticus]|uniref:hypothetical protein n=1 Tax=Marinobacter caseinilyticus TaxID=2692195 RepID=UPI0014076275|nr:hypothetical protein [Marinobacter caseinilyticus]
MTDSRLWSWAFGNTRRYTHFSQLTGEAQASAASIGAFGEVVVYEGDLVIGKKPGKELYFIAVNGVERVSDLRTCESELFGQAEALGTLPENHAPRVVQRLTARFSERTTGNDA